jgi:LmbE family N-acetylglucosaminyl deacetylase
MPDDWQRALCVVAHPDDMEYGASAAVAHWTSAGKHVAYLLVTRGEAGIDTVDPAECADLREAEQRASCAAVGVSDVTFLDHEDGVIEEGPALRRDISAAIRRTEPDLVVTLNHTDTWGPGTWNSADHRAVGRATLDAVSDAANRWIFPDAGGPHAARWVAIAGTQHPTHVVALDPVDVQRAAAALACHATYLRTLHPDVPVDQQAREWTDRVTGAASGVPTCSFELQAR